MRKNNKKGFTLAELLIVVAIIAVLVAISIPIFTNQLEKAKESTDMANIRAAYAEVMTAYLDDSKAHSATVNLESNTSDWKSAEDAEIAGVKYADIIGTGGAKTIQVSISDAGAVKIGDKDAKASSLDATTTTPATGGGEG